MGFSWQEYWSGLPCPPPGDLPITGKEPTFLMSPALASGLFTTSDILEAPVTTKYQSVWFLVAYIKITILCSNTLPWIIALLWWRGLHSSMKLWAMLYRATQDKQIIVKSADKESREEGVANRSSILATGTPWVVWKGKKIRHRKMSPSPWPGQKVSNMLLGKIREQLPIAQKEWSSWAKAEMMLGCGCL